MGTFGHLPLKQPTTKIFNIIDYYRIRVTELQVNFQSGPNQNKVQNG